MDEESLIDYHEASIEQRTQILVDYRKERIELDDIPDRLGFPRSELSTEYNPLLSHGLEDQVTLWDILPFYETVYVPLGLADDPEEFERKHGFTVDEINAVIDLAKRDTVGIALDASPIDYLRRDMDYVLPIFEELRPPLTVNPSVLRGTRLHERSPDVVGQAWDELQAVLQTIHDLPFYEDLRSQDRFQLQFAYSILLADGYDELAGEIFEQIQTEPGLGIYNLNMADVFITSAVNNPVADVLSWPRHIRPNLIGDVDAANELGVTLEFPGEIGSHLLSKRAPHLPDRNASLLVREEMQTHDLHAYMRELNQAIQAKTENAIVAGRDEVTEILEVAWESAEAVDRQRRVARGGMIFGISAIGTVVAGPLGGAAGFLTSAGLAALDEAYGDTLADRMIAWPNPGYMMTVYDAKERLRIDGEAGE